MNRTDSLGVLRRHTDKCDQPHVEDSSRPAKGNCCCHPGDVSGTDGCRKRRHQGIERADITFALFLETEQQAKSVANFTPGQEFETDGQKNAGEPKHEKHGRSPRKGVDAVDQLVERFHPVSPGP